MRGLEKKCTRWRKQTDTPTHGHGDSMTNSAQWGRVGENMTAKSSYILVAGAGPGVLIEKNKFPHESISYEYSQQFEAFYALFMQNKPPPPPQKKLNN